ncbi:MAG: 4Fe-4S dicluster domain-containing protein [Candidatus Eisenbacteria bacterium]|uniref:4Fe-4S dicluster domain-containing protein n=1 Tax=Eiseniibacteriota bacterium TaxID=2212470 RepID=A0A538TJM8_UNCEI|nr:MAG: 4Fe-4S dicluster domain-containing protein [Candidatus Eisenbacteria bacterium]
MSHVNGGPDVKANEIPEPAGSAPPKHWSTLAELRGSAEVAELREREFFTPSEEEESELPSRREFLKFLGAGAAFAAAGCARKPVEKILPYVKAPEELSPGNAIYFASTCSDCPAACGTLVKTREGRPIKIEGNKSHPMSRGALCARGQSSILNLYDPDRLRGPLLVDRAKGSTSAAGWSEIDRRAAKALGEARDRGGKLVFLTGTIVSPTTLALIQSFLGAFQGAEHVVYDAVSSDALAKAQELCYGGRIIPRYRLDQADVLVTFGADPLGTFLSPVEFARDFSGRRKPEAGTMSRFIAIEPILSLTGTNADTHLRVRPDHLYPVAMALAHELLVRNPRSPLSSNAAMVAAVSPFAAESVEKSAGLEEGTLAKVADELARARGRSLVLAGPQAAPAEQAVALQVAVNLLNSALGDEGVTVDSSQPSRQAAGSEEAVLRLVERMRAGEVAALLIHGVNPAHTLPAAVGFTDGLKRVPFVASFADRVDETAAGADVIAPDTHSLESWNDHEPRPGILSLTQPTISPLYDLRPFQETLLAWGRALGKGSLAATSGTWHQYLKDGWRANVYPKANAAAPFELFWEGVLREGVLVLAKGAAATARPFRNDALQALSAAKRPEGDGSLQLVLYTPVTLYDGRNANNAWLQELPDPVSKITWDNYVSISPSRAKALGVSDYEMKADVVTIDAGHAKFDLPVHVQPGLHPDVVAIAIGYGRTAAGRVGNQVGQNGFALAVATGGRIGLTGIPVRIAKTGRIAPLACVQGHQFTEHRPIIYETTFTEFLRDPRSGNEEPEHLPSMWSRHEYKGHKWGMAVDLSACIGCSACMVACRSENNVPVVGKEIVLRGREMDWIRIDRYYSGDAENPDSVHQPMLCQHCENAPCETVCPVLATVHSSEGLNIQIYNRCVGTRYCSNNCPYKVRRFNWFDYSHPKEKSLQLVLNPDVTVRSKGVMEKCTFCVQRIRDGKEHAKALGVPVQDGDIETACMQTCPTQAIVFGDLNDPKSRAAQLAKSDRGYHVLSELNTRSSITYQTKVRNREETSS